MTRPVPRPVAPSPTRPTRADRFGGTWLVCLCRVLSPPIVSWCVVAVPRGLRWLFRGHVGPSASADDEVKMGSCPQGWGSCETVVAPGGRLVATISVLSGDRWSLPSGGAAACRAGGTGRSSFSSRWGPIGQRVMEPCLLSWQRSPASLCEIQPVPSAHVVCH